jgi:hypothetical protein
MTVARMLMAAFVALAAGVAVENAKATSDCDGRSPRPSSCAAASLDLRTLDPGPGH